MTVNEHFERELPLLLELNQFQGLCIIFKFAWPPQKDREGDERLERGWKSSYDYV